MQTAAYGRDRGLQTRMVLTMFLLGLLYVVFFAVMISLFKVNLIFAVVLIGALAFFQYFTSDKLALAASRAKVVTPEQAPELHAMMDRLSEQAGVPKPRVAIIPTATAFALVILTSRDPWRDVFYEAWPLSYARTVSAVLEGNGWLGLCLPSLGAAAAVAVQAAFCAVYRRAVLRDS